MTEHESNPTGAGQASYAQWQAGLAANPDFQAIYADEAAKSALWLQLAAAREAAGLSQAEVARRLGVSQAQVARLEKRGYDAYTLTSLRRYVHALGDDFELDVQVRHHPGRPRAHAAP